jgi:rhodanese-related sulfurtransferase
MDKVIAPRELEELRRRGGRVELIDVRTPAEFREAHVGFAENVPLDRLDPAEVRRRRDGADGPLYVICKSGSRARRACERLSAAGVEAVSVEGGTEAWGVAGLPVVRGKKAVSLERQVRIAAGALVLIGSALGFFVHPYLIGLAAFVGAGLMFAGITDTCGMGMLLARMPWNRVRPAQEPPKASGAACESSRPAACCGP